MVVTPKELRHVLGTNVRVRRTELSMSQTALAAAVGVTPSFISQLEAGKTSISVDTLADLATKLRVSPSVLLGEKSLAATA